MPRWLSARDMAEEEHVHPQTIRDWGRSSKVLVRKTPGRGVLYAKRQKDAVPSFDLSVHYGLLRDVLGDKLATEMDRYLAIPSVWDFSYRLGHGDASEGLSITPGSPTGVIWQLDVEIAPDWPLALAHITSGFPQTYKAFLELKEAWGRYWKMLSDADAWYCGQIAKAGPLEAALSLDDSAFFRTIVGEVDRQAKPGKADYGYRTNGGRFVVLLEGRGILSATTQELSDKWRDQHLAWRRGFRSTRLPDLLRVRANITAAASAMQETARKIRAGAMVVGRCPECEPQNDKKHR